MKNSDSNKAKESYTLLLETFDEKKFHRTQNVLKYLNSDYPVTKELIDSLWLFIGGIALLNRTCGAILIGYLFLISCKFQRGHMPAFNESCLYSFKCFNPGHPAHSNIHWQ